MKPLFRCNPARYAVLTLSLIFMLTAGLSGPGNAGEQGREFFEFYDGYDKIIEEAYAHCLQGEYRAALQAYTEALKAAASRLASDRVTAMLGAQNCLVKLERYQDAIHTGEKILKIQPGNLASLGNQAFSYYTLGRYDDAITRYHRMLENDSGNMTALSGLSWAYYYQGDLKTAKDYFRRRFERDRSDKQWETYYRNVAREYNSISVAEYHTFLDYATSPKDSGAADTVLVTWQHNRQYRLDVAYSRLEIDYADTTQAPLEEDSQTVNFSSFGNDNLAFTYRRINTNETSLDDGNIYVASVGSDRLTFEGAYSVYETANSVQGSFTYRHFEKFFTSASTVTFIRRGDIENLATDKHYIVFGQEFSYFFNPLTVSLNCVVGEHSLMVRKGGFVVGNAAEDMTLQTGLALNYTRPRWTAGYEISYGRGDNLISGAKFHSTFHTLSVGVTF